MSGFGINGNEVITNTNTTGLINKILDDALAELKALAELAIDYKGTWNANTNTPSLASGVGNKGEYYVVSVAGSTNLNGISDWDIGDWAIFNGTTWQKVDNSELWIDDGTDLKTANTVRNINVQTGKFKAGSNTEIYESGGDSIRENTLATGNIIDKLGDALGATFHYFKDSAGTVIGYISSAGEWLLGKAGEVGSVAVRNASNVITIFLNANGDSYYNGGNLGLGTTTPKALVDINGSMNWKVRTVASATGTIAITDNVVVVDYTTTGTVALALPPAVDAWNTDGTGMIFTIMDKDANASVNNITINRDGTDTIIDIAVAQTSTIIGTNGGVIHIMPVSSTEWKVF